MRQVGEIMLSGTMTEHGEMFFVVLVLDGVEFQSEASFDKDEVIRNCANICALFDSMGMRFGFQSHGVQHDQSNN